MMTFLSRLGITAACSILLPLSLAAQDLVLENRIFTLTLSDKGRVSSLMATGSGMNRVAIDQDSPLLQIRLFGTAERLLPMSMSWQQQAGGDQSIELSYPGGIHAVIRAHVSDHYLTFTLDTITKVGEIEWVGWGPYHTTISDHIGGAVGVVRDKDCAIGLQCLNLKAVGGWETGRRLRVRNVAEPFAGGSRLQAYSLNRTRPLLIDDWSYTGIQAVPVPVHKVTGSRIALFLCKAEEVLKTIGQIEVKEGLPHPVRDGKWLKEDDYATSLRFITNYNENNIEECIALAKEAGVDNLYHPGIFETWGHFKLRGAQFPNGRKGVADCVRKAAKEGINLGAHSLSTFITPNDPYVQGRPDDRLARQGATTLAGDLAEDSSEIQLPDHAPMKPYQGSGDQSLQVVRIGDELISYSGVSKEQPWRLTGCQRGVYNTTISAHAKGAPISRLISHPYKVFFPDIRMIPEVAANLADFFNETGLERISFDGFEGVLASGHGAYAYELFAKTFYDRVKNKATINNSSDLSHYHWHVCTNESWGEPWDASFREAQLEHRLNSVQLMRDNFMPAKMGQFTIGDDTSSADINWIMALCAGLDAGVDFYVEPATIKRNKEGPAILQTIKRWEAARLGGNLSAPQKAMLRDPFNEVEWIQNSDGKPELRLKGRWSPKTPAVKHPDP